MDNTCNVQMRFKLRVKQRGMLNLKPPVRRSSARSERACGARGNFGCWWTLLSSVAPACKAVGAIREGLVSRGRDQPVPSHSTGWHGVSGHLPKFTRPA